MNKRKSPSSPTTPTRSSATAATTLTGVLLGRREKKEEKAYNTLREWERKSCSRLHSRKVEFEPKIREENSSLSGTVYSSPPSECEL